MELTWMTGQPLLSKLNSLLVRSFWNKVPIQVVKSEKLSAPVCQNLVMGPADLKFRTCFRAIPCQVIWGFFIEFGASHFVGPKDHGCTQQEVEHQIATSGPVGAPLVAIAGSQTFCDGAQDTVAEMKTFMNEKLSIPPEQMLFVCRGAAVFIFFPEHGFLAEKNKLFGQFFCLQLLTLKQHFPIVVRCSVGGGPHFAGHGRTVWRPGVVIALRCNGRTEMVIFVREMVKLCQIQILTEHHGASGWSRYDICESVLKHLKWDLQTNCSHLIALPARPICHLIYSNICLQVWWNASWLTLALSLPLAWFCT